MNLVHKSLPAHDTGAFGQTAGGKSLPFGFFCDCTTCCIPSLDKAECLKKPERFFMSPRDKASPHFRPNLNDSSRENETISKFTQ
jgi:hypothetical protein